jgi:hypothetical protein
MDGNKSVTAHFTTRHYTLTITIDGHGSVIKDPYQTSYPYNTVVEITAVADTNWMFSSWSGDLTGTENPGTITITSNKTVVAHFVLTADTTPPIVKFKKPGNAIYFMNNELLPFKSPIVVLSITVEANASDNESGINRVEFYVDGKLKGNDTVKPYTFDWRDFRCGTRSLKAVAYDNDGNSATAELPVFKWRFHPILLLVLLFLGMLWDSWNAPWSQSSS